MDKLRIHLFGNVELYLGAQRLVDFATQKSRALFAMLVLSPNRLFSRDALTDVFWPGIQEDRAKKCLSSDLWRVRSVLKSAGVTPDRYLEVRQEEIGFNSDAPYWLDVESFEQNLGPLAGSQAWTLNGDQRSALQLSIELYRGDLLEGIYDDWCLLQRESLRAQYSSAMETLMQYHTGREEWDLVVQYGQKLLGHDPLLEHIHRELMRCYYLMGNRPAAVRQFQSCSQLLVRELDIEPMEETLLLYEYISAEKSLLSPTSGGWRAAPTRPHERPSESAAEQIDLALTSLRTTQDWLENARQQLRQRSTKVDPLHQKDN